jgi:hypothetical protein
MTWPVGGDVEPHPTGGNVMGRTLEVADVPEFLGDAI